MFNTVNDIENLRFPEEREIEYERKEKLDINVQAAAQANLDQLAKLTTDTSKIARLKLKIEAAY